jgi:hypothetical protein
MMMKYERNNLKYDERERFRRRKKNVFMEAGT